MISKIILSKKNKIIVLLLSLSSVLMLIACGSKKATTEIKYANGNVEKNDEESAVYVEEGNDASLYAVEEVKEIDFKGADMRYSKEWKHGTCKNINGKTVIVTIALNDKQYKWNYNDVKDVWLLHKELYNLNIATEWIQDAVAEYNCNIEFIYDWSEDRNLIVEFNSDRKICENADKREIWKLILENIDCDTYLEQYEADNILFMICPNLPENWMTKSWAWIYMDGDECPYEFCMLSMYLGEEIITPATMAHELLHAFGAHDLYQSIEGERYGVSEEYVYHLIDKESDDIMFTTSNKQKEKLQDSIENSFSEIDAYYIGLVESCDDVKQFNLEKSEYDK